MAKTYAGICRQLGDLLPDTADSAIAQDLVKFIASKGQAGGKK